MNLSILPETLVERAYEAAFVPEVWPDVLSQLSRMTGTTGALIFSSGEAGVQLVASDADFEAVANSYFERFPGMNDRLQRLLAAKHAGFLTDHDVFTPAELDVHPIYRDFLRPRGLGFGVATAISLPENGMAVIHCEGPAAGDGVAKAAVPALNRLRPHLARAAMLSARIAFEKNRTAVESLEKLGFAACAVTQSGTVLVANTLFDKEMGFWTTRRKDVLGLRDRLADLLLKDALRKADAQGLNGAVLSVPLRASAKSGPAVLHVVPVRRAARDIFNRAAAILVLTRASNKAGDAAPLLQLLFDLTAAESRVAGSLGRGLTIEEIAATEDKSVNTVRNQLSRIMRKTGCRRQPDLVLLLSQLLPW